MWPSVRPPFRPSLASRTQPAPIPFQRWTWSTATEMCLGKLHRHHFLYVYTNTPFFYSFHIKSEPLEPPVATLSLVHENNNSPIGTPHSHIKAEPLDMGVDVSPPPPTLPPPMANSPLGEALKKYCSTCDISFNYVKTYLAHKQFYCKGKLQRPEASDSPSPNPVGGGLHAAMPLQSPSELLLLQKNKENLQEAAIWESQLMWEAQRKQLEWYYKCFWITDRQTKITEPELKPYPGLEPEPALNPRESKKTQLQPPQYRKYSRRISLPFQTRQTGSGQLSVLLSAELTHTYIWKDY